MASSSTALPKRLTTSAAPSKLLPRLRASTVNASDAAQDKQPLLPRLRASTVNTSDVAPDKQPLHLKVSFPIN
jgi:hypothetical protein